MRNLENKEKIIRVSGVLKVIAWLAMAFFAFSGIGALFDSGIGALFALREGSTPNPLISMLFWNAFPIDVINFIVWWNFWQLFRRLRAGHVFDGPTVARLAAAGKWKLAGWIYSIFSGTIYEYLAEQASVHNLRFEFVRLFLSEISHVGSLIGAVAIIFAAWLLREGQTLEEEQKLTV